MTDAPTQDAAPRMEPGAELAHQAREVRRLCWAGLAANLVLSAVKFAAGVLGRSQAVVADAVHSLSDSVTDVALLIGAGFWSKPADADHPHGHRRIETVVTLSIAAALVAVGAGLAYNAVHAIHGTPRAAPGWIAFAAAVASIVVKEALYRWTAAVGRRVKSSALSANAWHHRSDALSSIPAALAVAGAALAPGWSFLDSVGAVVVSLLILHAAWKIAWPALEQLVDRGAAEGVRRAIARIAMATDGVRDTHKIRTRYIGSGIQVDMHVLVDGDLTVRRSHEIATDVKYRLLDSEHDILDVVVHIEPFEDA